MDQNNNPKIKVRMVMEMAWLREVLGKYCPSVKGLSANQIPPELTMDELFRRHGLKPEDLVSLQRDTMESLAAFRKKSAFEAYEFAPDVDLSDDHYLWETPENKERCVQSIEKRYAGRTGGIVFYGPSNITLWYSLEKDMLPWKAQNHGMGGCTDDDLIHYADRLLYPFAPRAVFFQSGSNDLAMGMTVEEIIEKKQKMYSQFLQALPQAQLIIMSGLPLPGRTVYWDDTSKINQHLSELAEQDPRLHYMDATGAMLVSEGDENLRASNGLYFNPAYFRMDRIHLNKKGHDVWTEIMKQTLRELDIAP